MEALTLQGIQQKLMEDLGEFVKIVPSRAGSLSRAASRP
jgi:NifU-like protein